MIQKNKVDVRIAGKDYTLVGVESDEYIQKVGLYIDKKMHEIMKINSRLSTSMAAVLTSINVADDYFKAHENEVALTKEVNALKTEVERLRLENERFNNELNILGSKNTNLQLQLAKREAELSEVRNSLEKVSSRHGR